MGKMSAISKRYMWLAVTIAVYFVIVILPSPNGLTPEGKKAIALMVCAVISWCTGWVPIAISSLLFVFLQHVVNVAKMGEAVQNFATPTLLFVIASFLLAIALAESGLSKRISLKLTIMSKGSPSKAIFLILFTTALVSTVISDPPVAAAFTPICLEIIDRNKLEKGKSNMAKVLLIGVTLAALMGGVATPAGSSVNVLALSLLSESSGITISFAQWSMIGIPFVILAIPCMIRLLLFAFPPEISQLSGMDQVAKDYEALGKLSVKEKKFLIIMVLMIISWFTESIHKIPLPASATIGAVLFFIPGVDLLTWDNTKQKIGWDTILLIGASSSLGTALWKTGAAPWLADLVFSGIKNSPSFVVLLVVILFTIAIHLLVPVAPAIVSIMAPTLAAFAVASGMSPALLIVPMGFCASASYVLPLDPVALITFNQGHYSMGEFFKAGMLGSLVWTIFMLLAMLLIAGPVGIL